MQTDGKTMRYWATYLRRMKDRVPGLALAIEQLNEAGDTIEALTLRAETAERERDEARAEVARLIESHAADRNDPNVYQMTDGRWFARRHDSECRWTIKNTRDEAVRHAAGLDESGGR